MGEIIDCIKEILSCPSICGSTHDHALIEEENNAEKTSPNCLKKILLCDVGRDMLIIKPDQLNGHKGKRISCISPLFRQDEKYQHNRICDAVLIKENSGSFCKLLFIELKSTNTSGATSQLKSTKCFMDYVSCILEEFYKIKIKLDRRYIVLHTKVPQRLRKYPTRLEIPEKPSKDSNNPARRLVSSGDHISIKELMW